MLSTSVGMFVWFGLFVFCAGHFKSIEENWTSNTLVTDNR